ncbi:thiamine pyrophosphate-dependent enzyme, partial [Paracoccaceae bacterium]|nr:thiamine pyrophosphate-dependent enzyme [Paracoccaceae bacterium]
STPMILMVGDVSRNVRDREAFQEVDFKSFFGPISKWVAEINDPDRVPEYVNRAFSLATSGRPGPVVLVTPEDILSQITKVQVHSFSPIIKSEMSSSGFNAVTEKLEKSKKPLFVIGGSGWTDESISNFHMFINANNIPVTTSFRRQDLFDHKNDNFVGSFGTSISPKLIGSVTRSDLIIVIGARLGEMTTQGYSIISPQDKAKNMIHIHVDPNELNKVYNAEVCINVCVEECCRRLKDLRLKKSRSWQAWRSQLHKNYLEDIKPLKSRNFNNLSRIFEIVEKKLPDNSIVTLDAGNNAAWPQRFLSYGRYRRQIATTCGSMGYAIPAAVSSALLSPGKTVLCCVGDGGFMMSSQEISTAVQYGTKIIILLINNSSYGTIRMHQERDYPGRKIATDLKNPDFVKLCKAMGSVAYRVNGLKDFSLIFSKALKSKKVNVIEIPISINQLSHRHNLK